VAVEVHENPDYAIAAREQLRVSFSYSVFFSWATTGLLGA